MNPILRSLLATSTLALAAHASAQVTFYEHAGFGGGTGQDIATVGGAVAGGALGSRAGNGGQVTTTQPVQRCETVQGPAQPQYWDVTYNFRGLEHRVQMTTRPGSTITVNSNGEPRA